VWLEWFLSYFGDVQTILLRKPLAGSIFFLLGFLFGLLACGTIFATLVDNTQRTFVQYTDAQGKLSTVLYIAPPAGSAAMSPVQSPVSARSTISMSPVPVIPATSANSSPIATVRSIPMSFPDDLADASVGGAEPKLRKRN
jgi:hypothetical protein